MKTKLRSFFISFIGVKNITDFIVNSLAAFFGFVLARFKMVTLDNQDLFFAVGFVVIVDAIFGALANKKNFQTNRALKMVWYLGGYYTITFMVLFIEKAHPSAFWLSETIIMPILVFQTISILKNASLIGLIPSSLLKEFLAKIDKHKNIETPPENEIKE